MALQLGCNLVTGLLSVMHLGLWIRTLMAGVVLGQARPQIINRCLWFTRPLWPHNSLMPLPVQWLSHNSNLCFQVLAHKNRRISTINSSRRPSLWCHNGFWYWCKCTCKMLKYLPSSLGVSRLSKSGTTSRSWTSRSGPCRKYLPHWALS